MPQLAAGIGAFIGKIGAVAVGTTTIGSIAGRLLMSVAVSALSRALADKPKMPGIRIDTTLTGGTQPESFILGRYATGGSAVGPEMAYGDPASGVPNNWLVQVIDLGGIAGGEGLLRLFVDGEEVELSDVEDILPAVTETSGFPPVETVIEPAVSRGFKALGKYAGHLIVKFRDGTATEVDPYLHRVFKDYPDRPWTADMIGRGRPHAILSFAYNRQVYGNRPQLRFDQGGIPLYDPRFDSTAGGSGPQRWNDPATWVPSHNTAVQAYNILRGISLEGGFRWGGQAEAQDLPYAVFAAAMNRADTTIDLAEGGSEPRYRTGLEVLVADEPASVLEELLKAANGDVAEVGGEWRMRLGEPDGPVHFFADADVMVSNPQELDPFPGLDQTHNALITTWPDPDSLWEPREAPSIYNSDWEAADGDRRLTADLELTACPYGNQVQRVGRAFIQDERRFVSHVLTVGPEASHVEPLDTVAWTSARNGYIAKVFEVHEVAHDLMSGAVTLSLREVDPADYDWSPEFEMPSPSAPVTPVQVPVLAVPAPSVAGVTVDDADGPRRPGIGVTWTAAVAAASRGIEWELRRIGSAEVLRGSVQQVDAGGLVITEGVLPGVAYELRLRLVSDLDTPWTAWMAVTAPDVRLSMADLADSVSNEIADVAELAGVKPVTSLPAAGDKPDQIVMLVPDGILYRWDAVAEDWTRSLFAGIKPGDVDVASFAAGIEPVTVHTGGSLPTVKGTEALTWNGKLYRWNGTAYVATVPAADVTGALTNAQIAALDAAKLTGTLSPDRIGTGALLSAKLADNAVTVAKIADAAITGGKIASGAVSVAKFASGIEPVTIHTGGSLPGSKITETLFWSGKLYRWSGSAYVATVPAADVTGTLTNAQIAALDAAKLTGTLSPDRIGTGALLSAKLADNAVTTAKIASAAVDAAKLATGSVTTAKVAAGAITATEIGAGAITTGKIAAGAVTANEIAAGTITATQIASSAITTVKLDAGAVTTAKIAAAAVTANEIAANAITAVKIAAGAVTATQIAANAITTGKIAVGAVSATEIAAGAISTEKLSVGYGKNLLYNSTFAAGVSGFIFEGSGTSFARTSLTLRTWPSTWAGKNNPTLMAYQNGTGTDGETRVYFGRPSGGSGSTRHVAPVKAGDWLEASAFVSTHRCAVRMVLSWYDASDTFLGSSFVSGASQDYGLSSSSIPDLWTRIGGRAQAPANAASVAVVLQKFGTTSGTNSFLFIHKPMLCFSHEQATELSPWSSDGVTFVSGDEIITDAVTAAKIAAGAITTAKLAAGAVTANEIAAGTITATQIASSAITTVKLDAAAVTTAKIAAAAITADEIASNAVTAVKISAGAVEAAKIAAGAVTADKVAANAITAGKIAAGAVSATEIAAGAILASKLYVGDFTNRVPNPNIGAAADGWTLGAGWSVSSSQTRLHYSVSGSGWSPFAATSRFVVSAGEQLRVNYQVVRNTGSARVFGRLEWFDINGSPLSPNYSTVEISIYSTNANISAVTDVPAGAYLSELRWYVDRNLTTATLVGVDSVSVRLVNGGDLIVDGAVSAIKIAAGSVTADKVAAGAIVTSKLAAGAITAASGIIADLAVTTLKIAGNAVTIPAHADFPGQIGSVAAPGVQVAIAAIVREGFNTVISFGCQIFGSNYGEVQFVIRRGSIVLRRLNSGTGPLGAAQSVFLRLVDTDAGTGATTYTVHANSLGGAQVIVEQRSLSLEQTKR